MAGIDAGASGEDISFYWKAGANYTAAFGEADPDYGDIVGTGMTIDAAALTTNQIVDVESWDVPAETENLTERLLFNGQSRTFAGTPGRGSISVGAIYNNDDSLHAN